MSEAELSRPAFLTLNLDPVDSGWRFHPVFSLRTDDPEGISDPTVRLEANNAMNFSGHKGRVRVKIRISRRGWQWDQFANGIFIKFSDVPGGQETDVDPARHHQFVNVSSDPRDAAVLTFTYRNRIKDRLNPDVIHSQSSWGFLLKDGATSYPVDPIITNGGNPSEEGSLTDPP